MQLFRNMTELQYDRALSFTWLQTAHLNAKHQSVLTVAQEQASKSNILKEREWERERANELSKYTK